MKYTPGKLEIKPRSATLTSATASKVYYGTALTNEAVSESGDGFVSGEGAEYTVTGIQTEVGSSDNSFTYAVKEGTLEDNYEITTVFGTLTVTEEPPVPVKTGDDSPTGLLGLMMAAACLGLVMALTGRKRYPNKKR